MNWTNFITYGDSPQNAFETLCNQLFERFLKRTYGVEIIKFRVINGVGGDGGIEAYGQLNSGNTIAVQAKWFPQRIDDSEIKQIKKSILTAKKLRAEIKEYIICVPHNVNSLKIGRGNKPTTNHEENKINFLVEEIKDIYPDLKITWWFNNEILSELQQSNNEGVHKYWFDKEILSINYLFKHFSIQKKGWLNERYIPELHGQGLIQKEYDKLCFSPKYREKIFSQAKQLITDIKFCISQIEYFIPTNTINELNDELILIKENLFNFSDEITGISEAIKTGNDFYKPTIFKEVEIWRTKSKLEQLNATNIQKNALPKLILNLDKIHKLNLPQYIQNFANYFTQQIRLVIGEPGTGKTHGLANCVDNHLIKNSPAIIIQAKGVICKDWTTILSQSLEINWRKDEILSALETLAIRNDVQKATTLNAGEEHENESTKAIICVDGLEEEIEHNKEWYQRIRECEQLATEYPRVKFIFTARRYFYNSDEVPQSDLFDEVFLPREGDVAIEDVAPRYFSKDYYNIKVASPSQIKGLDSLLALRLFCQEYQNKSLNKTDKIITATRDLLNLKISRLNNDFVAKFKGKISSTRNPVLDSLEIIADFFYKNHEIEHDHLISLIYQPLKNYLESAEIDSLIDYLADNAFLIRFEKIEGDEVLYRRKYYYSITYQSLIEHIISERIYHEIKNGTINRIPQFLRIEKMRPIDFHSKGSFSPDDINPNQRIIEIIVSNIFNESGNLIGENDFLMEGFDEEELRILQLNAIRNAPKDLAITYKFEIDRLFFYGYKNRNLIIKHLIIPSINQSFSPFGSEYLHEKLVSMETAFARDKIWSGLDSYEIYHWKKIIEPKKANAFVNKLKNFSKTIWSKFNRFFIDADSNTYKLSPVNEYPFENDLFETYEFTPIPKSSLFNEEPLFYAWNLSTIDQKLRTDLRILLSAWAIKSPSEFLLLLEKIFNCNDPQIQEDLASVMLGVSSRLKNKERIKELALWSIENIFNYLEVHRNIIVRQGFRSIVERAYQYGLIFSDDVLKCRPSRIKSITLLPFESKLTITGQMECYPIVHDLAWYVIEKSYNKFLETPSAFGNGLKDNDCNEAKALLNEYRSAYDDSDLYAARWSLSVAIAYIRGLGFTRKKGNWSTQASHGSKSRQFTYEEKYTWLAVHHLQGYLSDYIPAKSWSNNREFVTDYSQITDIPNPSESIYDRDYSESENNQDKKEWIIKEPLSKELEDNIKQNQSITNWVNEEPSFQLDNWLNFNSADFNLNEPNREWLALLNFTGLYDSKQLAYSYFNSIACLIKKEDLPQFIRVVKSNPDSLNFITNIDGMHTIPETAIYCNPSDIVWMTWIGEEDTEVTFFDSNSSDEKYLNHTITKITQNDINGESYIQIPSKMVREIIDCYELFGSNLRDAKGRTLAFNHKVSDGPFKDSQELVLVDKSAFEEVVQQKGYEIVWFIELFKKKNPLNDGLDKNFHVQKTRKYFVWSEMDEKRKVKFWDEWASNIRDKRTPESVKLSVS